MDRNVRIWMAALGCALALAGCDEEMMTGADSGPSGDTGVMPTDGGSDECEGRTLCTTLGTSCDGDEVVTCADDADGCRVETREDCATSDQICNVSGGTASCIDACDLIPAAMRCTAAGRTCNGDSLEVCAANADGCLVLTTTDCAASPGGECDASGTETMCVLPVDPCAGVADACATAGTSCTGDDLVTCAPNAFGCLVTTTTDCTARAGGACDATGAAAVCTATDPCAGLTTCAAAGAACDGPELVTCAADAFGCLVETRNDCTDTMFGFCDADAAPTATCSTAATDPCMGMTICGTEPGRSCTDRSTLSVCELNAFGCYTATPTDCTAADPAGQVCDASGTMAMCVAACSLVDVCPAATYCDANAIVTCAADADGCLVETTRTACGASEVCDASGATPVCMTDATCPQAGTRMLDCSSGTVTGDTSMGSSVGTGAGDCATTGYEGPEQYWRFAHAGAAPVQVTIVAASSSTLDFDLFALDGGDGTAMCTAATLDCLDAGFSSSANETIDFIADPGDLAYIVYDNYSDATSTTPYTLTVTCRAVVCGNGTIEIGEVCDDGDTTPGDGCSDTCTVEPGYACTGTPSACTLLCGNGVVDTGEGCDDGDATPGDGCSATCTVEAGYSCSGAPSVCVAAAANSTCATATAITTATTLVGEDARLGGARPTATGCGTGAGTTTLYYAITVPAGATATATVTPTGTPEWDPVVFRLDSCADAACAAIADATFTGGVETMSFENTTGAAVTRVVGVRAWGATSGTFDLAVAFSTCGDGAVAGPETCDDGDTTPGDGCSATCTVEAGYLCTGAPSVCVVPYTTTAISAACVDASTGTVLHGGGEDDEISAASALPFAFSYFREAMTHHRVSTNGWLQLAPSSTIAGTDSAFTNQPIPQVSTPNGVVAPFWDDLVTNTAGSVRTLTTGTAGSRRFVVEWSDASPYAEAAVGLTFQAHLLEGTNVVELHYCSMTNTGTGDRHTGASATIGIESAAGTAGVQTSLDTAGAATTGTGYRYTPTP